MANSKLVIESTMDYERRLETRLKEFVNYFGKEFEDKLHAYSLVLEGKIKKSGKWADAVAGKVGEGFGAIAGAIGGSFVLMPAQGTKLGSNVGKTISEMIVDAIGSKHHKSNVVAVLPVIERWCEDKASFRMELVEAAFDIFHSFEMQFMRVETGSGPKYAMERLAQDAVNRALNYLRKENSASISKSVILGASKKVADIIIPGLGIKYKYLEKTKKWRTADLYSKTGIMVEISGVPRSYHTKEKGKNEADEYGFRRLLACENWTMEVKNYPSNYAKFSGEFTEYHYILIKKQSADRIKDIFDNFNTNDESLGEEKIRAKIVEIKHEILEEIINFKEQFQCFQDRNDTALKNIEAVLNNLNVIECSQQFMEYLKNSNQKILVAVKETQEKIDLNQETLRNMKDTQKGMAKKLEDVCRILVPQKLQEEVGGIDVSIHTYIPQAFHRRDIIKTDCLKTDVSDIFAISNTDVIELSQLFPRGKTMCLFSEYNAKADNLSRIIVLDNKKNAERNFEQLCKTLGKSIIHWLEKSENGKFLWKRSHGNISNLREFIENDISSYQPSKLDDINDKIILVCGGPGIGKSTLLSHFQLEQESVSGNLLHVYRLNLIDYRDELSKTEFSEHEFLKKIVPELIIEESALLFDGFDEICPRFEIPAIELLKFLKDKTKVKKILVTSRPNMQNVLENELGVFSYILAPFSLEDQKSYLWRFWQTNLIHSIKLEKVKDLSIEIKESNNAAEVRKICQQVLNTIEKENRDDTLNKIQALILSIMEDATYKSKIINDILDIVAKVHTASTLVENMASTGFSDLEKVKISIHEHAECYAVKLLEEFHQRVRDKEREFAGIPLQTKMLAEAFENDFRIFYKKLSNKRGDNTQQEGVTLPYNFNLIDLYERFVKRKCEIFYTDKVKCDLDSPIVQEALDCDIKDIDDYGKLAVAMLFSEEVICFDVHVDDEKKRKLLRVGIVTQHENKIDFIHRTFAEYFAAGFMAIAVRNPQNKVVRDFLHEHIFMESNEVIRYFFDRLLARKSVLHMAVLNADYRKDPECNKVTSLINANRNTINECDAAGRTALHLASSYGHEKIVQDLLNQNADFNLKDKLFHWSALTYADKGRHLKVAELLLYKNANVEDMFEAVKDIENYNAEKEAETVLHIAARDGHLKLVELFIGISKEYSKKICKAQDKKHKMASDLLKTVKTFLLKSKGQAGKIVNAQDLWHFTPLHYAAQMGHSEIVEALLKENADIDAQTKDEKFTPLHLAAQCGHSGTVNALLDNGAKLLEAEVMHKTLFTVPNEMQVLAMSLATKMFYDERRISIALCLIEYWCEKNSSLMTAGFDIFHHFEKLCTREDPYIGQKVPYRITPLHLAAYNNDIAIIMSLCEIDKASVNAGAPQCTPMMIAADHGFLRAANALLKNGAVVDDGVLYYALKNVDRLELKNLFLSRNPGWVPNCSS